MTIEAVISAMTDEHIRVHIGRRIRRRRKLCGLNQSQLAATLGYTYQQISRYEVGAQTIAAHTIFRLSQALSVPVSYFYEGL